MGHISYVHGYIIGDIDYAEENRSRIAELPETDSWPYLTRDLFVVPRPEHSYDSQLISFGAVYNGVERAWEEWLNKFERLLRSLYWFDAKVYLQTALWGAYRYRWEASSSFTISEHGAELPVSTWTFSGGPRKGLRDVYASKTTDESADD